MANDYWMDYLNDESKAKIREALLDRVCEELANEEGFDDKTIENAKKSKAVEQYIENMESSIFDGVESYIRDNILESVSIETYNFRDMVDDFWLERLEENEREV
jgi:hypothetical protein